MITIQLAKRADAEFLPDIERSSGEAFRQVPDLAWIADDDVHSVERHLELIRLGCTWVAKSGSRVIGFVSAERHSDTLHIWQIAVHAEFQQNGIGRNLINEAKRAAKSLGLSNATLTTFRNVAWNEPFYISCGFKPLEATELDGRLAGVLEVEALAGLPRDKRCAMLCTL